MRLATRLLPLFLLLFLSSCATIAEEQTVNQFMSDLTAYFTKDWKKYSVIEHVDKADPDMSFIKKTFGRDVLHQLNNRVLVNMNLTARGDIEGGYAISFLSLSYISEDAAKKANKLMKSSAIKNLMQSKKFIGYTSKHCGNTVYLVYSPAVATKLVRSYFDYLSGRSCNYL